MKFNSIEANPIILFFLTNSYIRFPSVLLLVLLEVIILLTVTKLKSLFYSRKISLNRNDNFWSLCCGFLHM